MAFYLNCNPVDLDNVHLDVKTRLQNRLRTILSGGIAKRIVILLHDQWSGKNDVAEGRIRLDDYIDYRRGIDTRY